MKLWGIAAAALLVAARPAWADDDAAKPTYRAVIDRIELEPAAIGGERLRVHVSALSLQGQLLDLTDPKTIKVYAGSTEIKAPYALGTHAAYDADTAIVVVVQTSIEYSDVLGVITESLDQHVLGAVADRTQVAILPYGETVGTAKLGPVRQVRAKLTELQPDGTAGEPALLDTLERALIVLKKAKTTPEGRSMRKLIVVISDGRDLSGDRERVTRVGERAAKEGVRIHSFAYSPSDVRRPLLLLGELSKRSLGTFRWVRSGKSESWTPAFQQLREEITQQYVLTYFLERDSGLSGRKLKLVTSGRAAVTSNELKVPALGCNGETCERGYCADNRCIVPVEANERGILGWILLVGGIVIGVIVLLGGIGFVITKRQQRAGLAPPAGSSRPGPAQVPHGIASPPPSHVAPIAAPGAAPVVAQPALAGPRLYILTGPRAGETVLLKHGFLIGKQPGCDLLIDDGYTSSQHAQIGMDHFGNCSLYDRGSTNGTFVNGVRVTEYVLAHGMSLRIGSTELRFLAQ